MPQTACHSMRSAGVPVVAPHESVCRIGLLPLSDPAKHLRPPTPSIGLQWVHALAQLRYDGSLATAVRCIFREGWNCEVSSTREWLTRGDGAGVVACVSRGSGWSQAMLGSPRKHGGMTCRASRRREPPGSPFPASEMFECERHRVAHTQPHRGTRDAHRFPPCMAFARITPCPLPLEDAFLRINGCLCRRGGWPLVPWSGGRCEEHRQAKAGDGLPGLGRPIFIPRLRPPASRLCPIETRCPRSHDRMAVSEDVHASDPRSWP